MRLTVNEVDCIDIPENRKSKNRMNKICASKWQKRNNVKESIIRNIYSQLQC